MRLLVDWFKSERQQMELKNRQLSSELAYLRAQVNPHFLFNTLNNIYSLAYTKSDNTPEAILKLSGMMRYMLYEANEERVLLEKEIQNLSSFIDLQKLRSRKQDLVDFTIEGNPEGQEIAPLLLIPLVENAFKHGNTRQAAVKVLLIAHQEKLQFRVSNLRQQQEEVTDTAGGLGLSNIKRRLELLYPGRHRLDVRQDEEQFEVSMTIDL